MISNGITRVLPIFLLIICSIKYTAQTGTPTQPYILNCSESFDMRLDLAGYVGGDAGSLGGCSAAWVGSDIDNDGTADVDFSIESSYWLKYCNPTGGDQILNLTVTEFDPPNCNTQGAIYVGPSLDPVTLGCDNPSYQQYTNTDSSPNGFNFSSILVPASECLFILIDPYAGITCDPVSILVEGCCEDDKLIWSATDASACGMNDGEISFTGLLPNTTYTLDYMDGGFNPMGPMTVTTDASGNYVLGGLWSDSYSNFSMAPPVGCPETFLGYINISEPPPPYIDPVSDVYICEGDVFNFPPITGTDLTGGQAYYDGPNGTGNVYYENDPISPSFTTSYYAYDGSGTCSSEQMFTINVMPNPSAYIATFTDVSCAGGSDGSATADATGGTLPYTYSWSTSDITPSINFLSAGTYTVTITDINGCFGNAVANISEPPPMSVSMSKNDVLCNGNSDGDATAIGSGGVMPYTYLWDIATGYQTTQTAVGLSAGNYTVDVTDDNGCVISGSITVGQPAPLGFSITTINPSCFAGNDGSIDLIPTGGTLSYTFDWDIDGTGDFDDTEDIMGLVAGVYTVMIRDANGCETSGSGSITDPPLEDPSFALTSGLDCQTSTSITANIYGTPGGTFSATPAGLSINSVTGDINPSLGTAGSYTVTYTTPCGESSNVALDIIEQPTLTAGSNVTICEGQNAPVTASGTASSVTWTSAGDGSFDNPNVYSPTYFPGPNDVAIGNVTLTVSTVGASPCTDVSDNLVINITPGPKAIAGNNIAICANDNSVPLSGSITNATGGIWSTTAGATGAFSDPTNLNAFYLPSPADTMNGFATLVLTTTGNGSCNPSSDTLIVSISSGIYVNATFVDDICTNSVGQVNISAIGGMSGGTYSYSFDGGTFSSTSSYSGLLSGTYTIQAYDGVACYSSLDNVVVGDFFPIINFNTNSYDDTCSNSVGQIEVFGENGGTAPYIYSIDNGSSYTTGNIFSGLPIGLYPVQIQDANGCTSSVSNVSVVDYTPTIAFSTVKLDDTCSNSVGEIQIVAETGGKPPYSYSVDGGTSYLSTNVFSGLMAGSYSLYVKDANGCIGSSFTTLNNYSPTITLSVSTVDDTCGIGVGEISIFPTGGSSPYQYSVDNGTTYNALSNQSGLVAGTYNVMVMDINGCTSSAETHTVNNYGGPVIALDNRVDVTCSGGADGFIEVTVTGGNAPYTYSWNGGTYTTEDIYSLPAGTYDLDITDGSGCMANLYNTVINQPSMGVTFTYSTTDVSCNGADDGEISIMTDGGTPSYSYSTDGGSSFNTSSIISGLLAGNYNVQVQDALGCLSAVQPVIINQPPAMSIATWSVTDVSCFGLADGSATALSANGGVAPYSYQWYDANGPTQVSGANDTVVNNLPAGVYFIEVIDANGCPAQSTSVSILEPAEIVYNVTSVNPICYGLAGSIQLDVTSGGTSPYSYSDDGGASFNAGNNPYTFAENAGSYSMMVQDANGCLSNVQTASLVQPDSMQLSFTITHETCPGDNDGAIDMTVLGGSAPYNYTWTGPSGYSATTEDISGLTPGQYPISVSDVNNCSSNTMIVINAAAPINFTATAVSDTCSLSVGRVTFTGVNGGTPPYGFGIGVTQPAFTSTTPVINNVAGGSYFSGVIDINGCISQLQPINIGNIIGQIPAGIAGPIALEYGTCVDIPVDMEVVGGDSYIWYGTENPDTTLAVQTVTIDVDTYYYVETFIGACSRGDSVRVFIDAMLDCSAFDEVVTNAFSPDGDGVNDNFNIGIQHLLDGNENSVTIYNRWGDEINHYVNYNNQEVSWDGTNKAGVFVTNGTYYYVVEIPAINYTANGWVEVVR